MLKILNHDLPLPPWLPMLVAVGVDVGMDVVAGVGAGADDEAGVVGVGGGTGGDPHSLVSDRRLMSTLRVSYFSVGQAMATPSAGGDTLQMSILLYCSASTTRRTL